MQVRPTLPAIYICKHFLKNEKRQVETMVSRKKKEKIDLAVTSHNSPLGSSFQLQDDCISIHAIRRLIGQQTLESHFLTMNCTHIYNTNSKKKKKEKKMTSCCYSNHWKSPDKTYKIEKPVKKISDTVYFRFEQRQEM